jgi:hypothetical protein
MSSADKKFTETGLPWHLVEGAINREIKWLEGVIEQTVMGKVPGCDDCRYTFRKIALLIVTGKIKAKEFTAREGHDLWDDFTQKHGTKAFARHGGDWHRKMMDVITEYFENQGFEVIPEPFLSQGFADLGIYKDGHMDLFVEIGTTSAYKLWWNLQMLTNCRILLVPDEKRVIEFTCHSEQRDTLRSYNRTGLVRNATTY